MDCRFEVLSDFNGGKPRYSAAQFYWLVNFLIIVAERKLRLSRKGDGESVAGLTAYRAKRKADV